MDPAIRLSAGISKWDIRQKVWDYIEDKNLADFPRPVHNRIPNFKGAAHASEKLPSLQEFRKAEVVKVNPDTPQKNARFLTLEGSYHACQTIKDLEVFNRTSEVKVDPDKPLEGVRLAVLQVFPREWRFAARCNCVSRFQPVAYRKHFSYTWKPEARKTLLVPTPRLRTGLFNRITPPPGATKDILRKCSTSQGVKDYSVPVGLDAKVHVDLVVVGSVAVSEKGWRIGKGEGFADMEFAMMASMGAVNEDTVIVTTVHDCQVVDIPDELVDDHDLTVDFILTPTRVIRTNCTRPKPLGIIWSKISAEMLQRIPILKNLRYREEQAGKDVCLKDEVQSVPEENHRQSVLRPKVNTKATRTDSGSVHTEHNHIRKEKLKAYAGNTVTTVYIGNIPQDIRVSELKAALREHNALPLRLNWHGAQHRAFLDYKDQITAEMMVSSLSDLCISGKTLRAELAKNQRSSTGESQSSEGTV